MDKKETELTDNQESENDTLELYKIAFARLNFQDDYLFKISAAFLTANGALAALAAWAAFRGSEPHGMALAIIAAVGIFLSIIWYFWIRHNDYWHSVWTGSLRELEGQLNTTARLFDANHEEIANKGGRNICCVFRGHSIAQGIPIGFGLAWLSILIYVFANCAA